MSSKPKYKLTYFNMRGLAEPIRYIFAYLNIDYEDNRIELGVEWENILSGTDNILVSRDFPWGNLPVLKEDNFVLCQSHAIARYLGYKYQLTGANQKENAKCDEYLDTIKDYHYELYPLFREKNEIEQQRIKERILRNVPIQYFKKFNKDLEDNGGHFIVGRNVTYADFLLVNYFSQSKITLGENIFDNFTAIERYIEHMFAMPQIKTWIATRPNTIY